MRAPSDHFGIFGGWREGEGHKSCGFGCHGIQMAEALQHVHKGHRDVSLAGIPV